MLLHRHRRGKCRLPVVLVALVGLCLLAGATPALAVDRVAEAAAPGCPAVVFIGLRGSGEPAERATLDMGKPVFDTYRRFKERADAAGLTVLPYGLDKDEYPAVEVPDLLVETILQRAGGSVQQGAAGARGIIDEVTATNPAACVALVGYSQGAWAIGEVLRTASVGEIDAVVLYGDPRFDDGAAPSVVIPESAFVGDGALRFFNRAIDPVYIPIGVQPVTRSFCIAQDPVCNFDRDNRDLRLAPCMQKKPTCVHLHYVEDQVTASGADSLAARFLAPASPPAPVPVPVPTPDRPQPQDLVIERVWTARDGEQDLFDCNEPVRLALAIRNPNAGPVDTDISFLADSPQRRLHYEERRITVPPGSSQHDSVFVIPPDVSGGFTYTADIFPEAGRRGSDASQGFTIDCDTSAVADARSGWFDSGVTASLGDTVEVRVTAGSWTHRVDGFPYNQGQGNLAYRCADHLSPAQCAEPLPQAPQGALIADIGGSLTEIGVGTTFTAARSGTVRLRINDADGPSAADNAGALTVAVTASRP